MSTRASSHIIMGGTGGSLGRPARGARGPRTAAGIALLVVCLVAHSRESLAQQPEPPKQPASAAPPAPKPAAPPTLDDLLGIKPSPKPAAKQPETPDAEKPKADAISPDRDKAELERALTAEEMGDAFKQAVALMGDASTRLEHKDPGLETQRIQEDAIKRLDQLISSLKQKQSSSKSSGKPKPGENSDSQDDARQQKQGKPGDKGQQQQKPQGAQGNSPGMGPTLQEGALAPQLESARAAWGSLPARVREMLMQGTEDRFSARYKLLTQEYYKRLAEENTK